jgi:hypothetical protein
MRRRYTPLSAAARAMKLLGNPELIRRALLARSARASFLARLEYDALPRAHYAYGVYHAALQARALGLPRISAIEFGVAAAAGLVELEKIADAVRAETGVETVVYGFDTASGMPPPVDYRDMPYVWTAGLFSPDHDIQRAAHRSTIIMGDVRETVPRFCQEHRPPPVGFVAHDLDYYSSTRAALELFAADPAFLLPRVFCYLDDCIGDDHELHSEFTGELAAVRDFNTDHPHRKVAPIFGLRHKRRIPAPWNDVMFVMHAFDHPLYNTYTNPRWPAPKADPPRSGGVP